MNDCHIFAPCGDYECSGLTESLSPSDSGEVSVANDSGRVPIAPTSPEFFDSNTATARFVLAMPFILGFLIAAILVAGYVFTW